MALGAAAGYLLGTAGGRRHWHQALATLRRLGGREPVRQKARAVIDLGLERIDLGIERARDTVENRERDYSSSR